MQTRLQAKFLGNSKLVRDLNWKLGTLNFKTFEVGGRVEGVLKVKHLSLHMKIYHKFDEIINVVGAQSYEYTKRLNAPFFI